MLTKQDIIQKIKDDLYLTTKQNVMNNLPENQNALFIGKLRIPTIAHIEIIENAIKKFNHVVICIVKATKDVKKTLSLETQVEILESIFGNKISVITHSSGNIISIINKSPKKIKYILAGSDRVDSYQGQLKTLSHISIVETKRDMDDDNNVSATKTIEAILLNDEKTFKKMTHRKIWNKFNEIQRELKDEAK